jgi:hypothetical protein
MPRRLEIDS